MQMDSIDENNVLMTLIELTMNVLFSISINL